MLTRRLIATKLYAPVSQPILIVRQRLIDRLEKGYHSGSRLTLVSAPAGYGKSSLVASWLNAGQIFTWLTLDDADNDPARFFAYLVAAFRKIDPDLGEGVLSLLELPQLPTADIIAGELINDISLVSHSIVLVLDDYHAIHHPLIHDSLDYLIEYQPANLHLVMITREDPPFPLGRLRASLHLMEVRAHDLRFTFEEAQDFLTHTMGLSLTLPAMQHLEEMTEGWIVGLQLAGLALQGQEDASSWVSQFGANHQYIIDYLVEEVLKRLPADVQTFLHETCILERFNASLCQAVLQERVDAPSMLDRLERTNLFLIPLDSAREWFRYHRLFADVLHPRLDEQTEKEIHRRAAAWFANHSLIPEAITHYLACGETHAAAGLIRQAADDLLKSGEMHTLSRWIDALSAGEMPIGPDLAMVKVLSHLFAGEAKQAGLLASQIELQARDQPDLFENGRLLAIKAWMMFTAGATSELVIMAERALEALPPEDSFFRILALLALGTGHLWMVNMPASCTAYQQAYTLGVEAGHPFGAVTALSTLIFNLVEMGEQKRAEALCREALAQFSDRRGHLLPIAGIFYIVLATILFEQNQLEPAEDYTRRGLAKCKDLLSTGIIGGDGECLLAELTFVKGDRETAFAMIDQTRQFAKEQKITFLDLKLSILESKLRLQDGDDQNVQRVGAILDEIESRISVGIPAARESFQSLRAKQFLIEGRMAEAQYLLSDLENTIRIEACRGKLIPILVLRARAYHQQNQVEQALAAFKEAIQIAAPEGFFHSILRSWLVPVSYLEKARPISPQFIDALLQMRLQEQEKYAPAPSQPGHHLAMKEASSPEPLSEQELKVLKMIVAGCSNQEIARKLVITEGTAKWHVHNILGKLGAHNRAQAIALAHELGLR